MGWIQLCSVFPGTGNWIPSGQGGSELGGDGVGWGAWDWVSSGVGREGNDVPEARFGWASSFC